MIDHLGIRHFKSIRELDLDCSKVNVFIGEPNTGKSNILEALGLVSWLGYSDSTKLNEFVRFRYIHNLFFDDEVDTDVQVEIGKNNVIMGFRDNQFSIKLVNSTNRNSRLKINHIGEIIAGNSQDMASLKNIRFYKFKSLKEMKGELSDHFMPPDGRNMVPLVLSNKNYKSFIYDILNQYGFSLVLKPQERIIEYQKTIDGIAYSYPYELLSDTLRRIIFYTLAMDSSEKSTLIFNEPEAHAFPYYTKYLGERIGKDPTNQFFIATHNPYLLNSIIEKTPKDSIRIFLTYYENYETKVKQLSSDEVEEALTYDPFLNLDHFLEEGNK